MREEVLKLWTEMPGYKTVIQELVTQGPAVSASPGSLLEMQVLRVHSSIRNCVYQRPQVIYSTLKYEVHLEEHK